MLRPHNVLTLSCKNRLTCERREAARRLPRPTRSGRSELQPACRARAVRAARGGAPPGQRTGGFCQLVRTVGQPLAMRRVASRMVQSNQVAFAADSRA